MNHPRVFKQRHRGCGGLLALLLLAMTAGAGAQGNWQPTRPVELVVGTGPGSAPDSTARLIQEVLRAKKLTTTPVTVMNRPGGGGALGWSYLNSRAGDAHYIMLAAGNLSVAHLTGAATIGERDLTIIAMLFHEYVALSVRTESPLKSGRELLDKLKADPASASLAVSSVAGSTTHIAAAFALKAGGVDLKKLRTVVFDTSGKSISAALGGHVDVAASSLTEALGHARGGRTRILGYTAPRRLGGELAKIPTWREQGADMDFSNYRGIAGPKGMTAAQLAYWEQVLAELDRDERWRADLEKNLMDRDYQPSVAARRFLERIAVPIRATLDELGLLK